MKFWIYCVLREACCLEAAFCCPAWGTLGTENPLVIPVTDATAPGGSWSWYCLWRNYLGLRIRAEMRGVFTPISCISTEQLKGALSGETALPGPAGAQSTQQHIPGREQR